jgi:uncharacterized protein
MKSKRVILDTNLWISFLITKRLKEVDHLILDGTVKLIFSKESIEKFVTVARRSKYEKYFTENSIWELRRVFDLFGTKVNERTAVNEFRDLCFAFS